jgi:hypothetical protein
MGLAIDTSGHYFATKIESWQPFLRNSAKFPVNTEIPEPDGHSRES